MFWHLFRFRYLAVTQPLSYKKRRTKGLAMLMILVVWILAILITCPPILGWYAIDHILTSAIFLFSFCLFETFLCFCHLEALRFAERRERKMRCYFMSMLTFLFLFGLSTGMSLDAINCKMMSADTIGTKDMLYSRQWAHSSFPWSWCYTFIHAFVVCSHLVTTASQKPKYTLSSSAATIERNWIDDFSFNPFLSLFFFYVEKRHRKRQMLTKSIAITWRRTTKVVTVQSKNHLSVKELNAYEIIVLKNHSIMMIRITHCTNW